MLKKLLLTIFMISFFFLGSGQNISFEASEGFTLGDINNQQGWNYWGSASPGSGTVVSTTSSIGSNSLHMISNNTQNDGSVRRNITGFDITEYSFDYKIENIDGSDYFMVMRDNNNSIIGAFTIDYEAGNVAIYDGILDDVDPTNLNIIPNTWYNFKMLINKTTNVVQYFVNNISLGVKSILSTTSNPAVIDLAYDDFGTGFFVDNIIVSNSNVLGTSENTKYNNDIKISPNPASDYIRISTNDKIISVEIYDISGKIVLSDFSGGNWIGLSVLKEGTYLLKIKLNNRIITRKIIKK